MVFNSFAFAVYLPIVVLLYFALPHRWRWVQLLIASYVFYGWWRLDYLVILIGISVLDYAAGVAIERSQRAGWKLFFLATSMAGNLGLLFFFKYCDFLVDSLQAVLSPWGLACPFSRLELILPIGLSFHTFQALSYTMDVYRGRIPAEKNLGHFALFVAFFPQLVAGPIERAGNLLVQFKDEHFLRYDNVADGMRLMAWGLFKKMVVADRLALMVNAVYGKPEDFCGPQYALATFCFALQIYCDFSGYSDIALGAAKLLGFDLMVNFRTPYFATSLADFWKRWHISLSGWFRDNLYIPLGGNQVAAARRYCNLFLVFLVSGLWHGANWTFALWGAFHGACLVLYYATKDLRAFLAARLGLTRFPRAAAVASALFTFAVVCFGWIFFRAASVHDAFHIIGGLGTGWDVLLRLTPGDLDLRPGMTPWDIRVALAAIICLIVGDLPDQSAGILGALAARPKWVRWPAYYATALAILAFGMFGESKFIYFQF